MNDEVFPTPNPPPLSIIFFVIIKCVTNKKKVNPSTPMSDQERISL